MKVGVVSDCIHVRSADGRVGTENHILLRQFVALASHFDEMIIACPFESFDEQKVVSWYPSSVRFIALPPAGGDGLKDKIGLLKTIPAWFSGFRKLHRQVDIVYQRFPNNLNIPGFFFFYFLGKKVFATYTGTWLAYSGEPFTYRLQRWLLRNVFRGPVWVYTFLKTNSPRIHAGFSPSYSEAEWNEETENVREKVRRLQQNGLPVLRMITVGKLIDYKNQLTILKACVILKQHDLPFRLSVVGSGPMRDQLQSFVHNQGMQEHVAFLGNKSYQELRQLYREHDLVVQAPLKEGFGKVPVEGFFHGLIPVLSDVSMARYMTGGEERGFLFDPNKPSALAELLEQIKRTSNQLPAMIENGRTFARTQTLEKWAKEYYEEVSEYYTAI